MVINTDGELIIANAAKDSSSSQILVYGACNFSPEDNATEEVGKIKAQSDGRKYKHHQGQRAFMAIVTDVRVNPGAEHPYGLTLDSDQARSPS